MTTVIISAPITNRASHISAIYGRKLYKQIKEEYPNVTLGFIQDKSCVHGVTSMLQKFTLEDNDDVLFVYAGHGKSDRLCGISPPHCSKGKGGMVDLRNVTDLKNVVVQAVCCWSSCVLGREAEDLGVQSYLGWRVPLYVAFNDREHAYADDVIDVWRTFPLRMLDGYTFAQSLKAMTDKNLEYEKYYLDNVDDLLYADYYAKRFKFNRTGIVPYGDLFAKIS